MRLGPLIFQAHLDPFAQRLLRASPLAIAQHLVAKLKQDMALTSLAISQQRQGSGFLHDTAQQAYRLRQELAVFASTSQRPNQAGGPVPQANRPAFRLVGG